jgi:hypothetical protein
VPGREGKREPSRRQHDDYLWYNMTFLPTFTDLKLLYSHSEWNLGHIGKVNNNIIIQELMLGY